MMIRVQKWLILLDEILKFYTSLYGTAASTLQGVYIHLLRKGSQLSPASAEDLIRPVTHGEIDRALASIDDSFCCFISDEVAINVHMLCFLMMNWIGRDG